MRHSDHFKHAAAALLLGLALSAGAQPYPTRSVEIVVPYNAGGGYDNFARPMAAELQKLWKQPVVVQNRPGATEMIAAEYVKQARPDGHVLFFASEVALVTNPFIFKKLRYNPEQDFEPVTRILDGQLVYVIRAGLSPSNMREYIDLARERGGQLSYASAGQGGIAHVAFDWLALENNLKITHIPYQGAAPSIQDMLGGHVDTTIVPLGAVNPYLKTGKLRAFGVTGPHRLPDLPGVSTLREQGYPALDTTFFLSIVAPRGTPVEVQEQIARDIRQVVQDPEFQKKHMEPYGYLAVTDTPKEFKNFLIEDRKIRRNKIESLGISLD